MAPPPLSEVPKTKQTNCSPARRPQRQRCLYRSTIQRVLYGFKTQNALNQQEQRSLTVCAYSSDKSRTTMKECFSATSPGTLAQQLLARVTPRFELLVDLGQVVLLHGQKAACDRTRCFGQAPLRHPRGEGIYTTRAPPLPFIGIQAARTLLSRAQKGGPKHAGGSIGHCERSMGSCDRAAAPCCRGCRRGRCARSSCCL